MYKLHPNVKPQFCKISQRLLRKFGCQHEEFCAAKSVISALKVNIGTMYQNFKVPPSMLMMLVDLTVGCTMIPITNFIQILSLVLLSFLKDRCAYLVVKNHVHSFFLDMTIGNRA